MKKIAIGILTLALLLMLVGCHYSLNVGTGSTYVYDDASFYTMGGASLMEDIRELDITWVSGKVTVKYHDGEDILISETASVELSENNSLYYRVVGKTLKIQYAKSGVWTNMDFAKELTVSLPRGEKGSETAYALSFDTVSADVDIHEIYTQTCEAENVSGNIRGTLLGDVSSVDVETVSGNVNLSVGELASFDIESVSGNVTMMGGNIREGKFDSVSGDFLLELPPNNGYTLEFESVSGDVDLFGDIVSKEGDRYTVGDGTRHYEIETVSGNAKISIYKV